ncbi:MAG: DUF2065 domain-containing protein [Zetaproteobacteria bacterium]|nr:MAG: DUF2065 domain-containing protein [Zetaproteobacteria bacterium]
MRDLWAALGLVLVLEGAMYALFPQGMLEMMRRMQDASPATLRLVGIAAVAVGWAIVWFVRH